MFLAVVCEPDDGLLENGNFETDVTSWFEGPDASLMWDPGDAFQQEDSGSAFLTASNVPAERSGSSAFQCVEIEQGKAYVLSAYARVPGDLAREGLPGFRVAFHDNPACGGIAADVSVAVFDDFPTDEWKLITMWTGPATTGATHAWVGITTWGEAVPSGPVPDSVSIAWDGVSFADAGQVGALLIHKVAGGDLLSEFEFMINADTEDTHVTTEGEPIELQLPSGEYRVDERLAPAYAFGEVMCTVDGLEIAVEVTPSVIPGFQGVSDLPVLPGRVTECVFTNDPVGPHKAIVPGVARSGSAATMPGLLITLASFEPVAGADGHSSYEIILTNSGDFPISLQYLVLQNWYSPDHQLGDDCAAGGFVLGLGHGGVLAAGQSIAVPAAASVAPNPAFWPQCVALDSGFVIVEVHTRTLDSPYEDMSWWTSYAVSR